MRVDGYGPSLEVRHCKIHFLTIDRWQPSSSILEYNALDQIEWRRPSTTNHAVLHNNNIESSAAYLFRVASTSDQTTAVDATGNYWGAAATAQMQASTQNISAIYDFYDNTSLVMVNYSGYSTTPIAGAGPNW
jgi:hypothetical protein